MTDDTEGTPFPICPYCGTPHQEWWDTNPGWACDGDEWNINCDQCGKDYHVTIHIEYAFDTARLEP